MQEAISHLTKYNNFLVFPFSFFLLDYCYQPSACMRWSCFWSHESTLLQSYPSWSTILGHQGCQIIHSSSNFMK